MQYHDMSSQLVYDPVSGDWVVVAPKRVHRPNGQTAKKSSDVFSIERLKSENIIATFGKGTDRITVIENKFPTFEEKRGISGHQELLVEGTGLGAFSTFSVSRIVGVLQAYASRAAALRAQPGLASMIVFKNEGPAAGASQLHAHSQIFGLSFVPERLQRMSDLRKRLVKEGRTSHALAMQHALRPRSVFSDRFVTAFAHPAARFPYEIRIVPKRVFDHISEATPAELRSIAKAFFALFPFVREQKLSYNLYFHDVFADPHEHFEIRFVPRGVTIWGGFELDAGININPVTAEQSALAYRESRTASLRGKRR